MESKNIWYPTLREHVGNNLLICNSEDCIVIISMVYFSVNILNVQLIILAAQDDPNAINWVMLDASIFMSWCDFRGEHANLGEFMYMSRLTKFGIVLYDLGWGTPLI